MDGEVGQSFPLHHHHNTTSWFSFKCALNIEFTNWTQTKKYIKNNMKLRMEFFSPWDSKKLMKLTIERGRQKECKENNRDMLI